jgi:hypothetical protein
LIEALGDRFWCAYRHADEWEVTITDYREFHDPGLWLALARAWLAIHEKLTARDIGEMSKRRWEAKQAREQAKPDDIDWSKEGYPVSPMERNWMYCAAIHNKWYMDYRKAAKRPIRYPPHWMVGAVYPSSSLPINLMGSDALFHGCYMLQMNRNLAAKRPFPPRNQTVTWREPNGDIVTATILGETPPRHPTPVEIYGAWGIGMFDQTPPASEPYPWAKNVSLQGGHVVVVDNGHLDPVQRPYAGRVGIVDDDVTIGPVCVRFPEDGDVAQGYLRAFAVEKLRPAPHDFAIGDRVRVVSDAALKPTGYSAAATHIGETGYVRVLSDHEPKYRVVFGEHHHSPGCWACTADLLYLPPSAPAAKLPSFDDVLGIYKDCAKYRVGDFIGKGQTFGKVLSMEHDRTDGDSVHHGWSYQVRLGSGYACWWAEDDVVKIGGAK